MSTSATIEYNVPVCIVVDPDDEGNKEIAKGVIIDEVEFRGHRRVAAWTEDGDELPMDDDDVKAAVKFIEEEDGGDWPTWHGEENRQPDLQVVLSLYGPRGGSRAAEAISRDDAIRLRDVLNRVLP